MSYDWPGLLFCGPLVSLSPCRWIPALPGLAYRGPVFLRGSLLAQLFLHPSECWFFFFINLLLLIIIIGAGGVAQQLRVCAPLVEDLNFIPSTQVGPIKTTQLQRI